MTESCVEDLADAFGINDATLAIRFERGLDASFFLGCERRRFVFDRFHDVPACGEVPQFGWNVLAVPVEDSCAARHATILRPFGARTDRRTLRAATLHTPRRARHSSRV